MSEFLRTVIQQDVALSASSQTNLIDLPVNPLSHILFTLRAVNNTATSTNFRMLTAFLDFVTKVEVLYKGQAIIEGSLQDLMVLNSLLCGFKPGLVANLATDNNERAATFMLSFSRVPYWLEEAFPATSRGELSLRITTGANPTGADAFRMQVETVELLNAAPKRFCRYTTYTGTQVVTGENDLDIPRGNKLVGVQLFGTTVSTTTSTVNTVETVKLLVDNQEMYYSLANWEGLHGELLRRIGSNFNVQPHQHTLVATGNTALNTVDEPIFTNSTFEKYGFLDFDPLKDDNFLLDTNGRGRVAMRVNFGDTAAMRFMPIELMNVGGPSA